ncbi:hypothetical protein [Psychroflexus aestuariivivens]|uniref:hypothetical protein n=1 Tax=Psychroflexus aestuariivivens TaxID=1795040 RepID=UPI000FD7B1C4|nr:hypothetical protein [Psychroflexus aestuariivivens]
MYKIFKISLLSLLISLGACQSNNNEEESKAFDKQMKETVKIHDDVMPELGEINSMIERLEAEKENLKSESEDLKEETLRPYDQAIVDLKRSHEMMMSWMENFSNTFSRTEINEGLQAKDKDSIKAKMKSLNTHYESAEEMKKAITDALENAQKLLAK